MAMRDTENSLKWLLKMSEGTVIVGIWAGFLVSMLTLTIWISIRLFKEIFG